jgi:DNA-binding NtrC family response regulator
MTLPEQVEKFEKGVIESALRDHSGNISQTSLALGVTFRALRYKIDKYGVVVLKPHAIKPVPVTFS